MIDLDDELDAGKAKSLYRHTGAGMAFAFSILVFVLAGWWIDGKFDTSPWFLLLGLFLGFPLALYSLVNKLDPERAKSWRKQDRS